MKKLLTGIAAVCAAGMMTLAASAESQIELRIEGISENFLHADITLTDDTMTLLDALAYAAEEYGLEIKGIETAYITSIEGDTAGSFGGWDGWLYTVDGAEPVTGMDGLVLGDGMSVVVYYGDPYGAGMQYPYVDYSRADEGVLRFASMDAVYDESFNVSLVENPVAGAQVRLTAESGAYDFVTDENGEIFHELKPGSYAISIEKTSEAGLPLVLRFAEGEYVYEALALETENTDILQKDNPGTGVTSTAAVLLLTAAASAVLSRKPRK